MSSQPPSSQDQFSLGDVIKKRKAQAARREQLQIARSAPPTTHRAVITPLPARPTIQTPRANRAGSPGKWLSPRQMRLLFGALAAAAILLLAGIGIIVITSSASAGSVNVTPNLSLPPLPVVSAGNVLAYLQNAGVPVTNIREFTAPNDTFAASAEVQFEVYRGQDKGLFILLSYPSSEQRVPDLFKVEASSRFSTWSRVPISNVLMLISPDTAATLRNELSNRLTQYLVAPYRPHYPTSTPAITPTANP